MAVNNKWAAMNAQGAALLKAQQNGTYKPPTPTPYVAPIKYGSATANAGYSLYDKPVTAPAPTYITPVGNKMVESWNNPTPTPTVSTGRVNKSTVDTTPTWLQNAPDMGGLQQPADNSQQMISDLSQAQMKANMARLDSAYNTQRTNIDNQYGSIDQNAYDANNQAAAQSDVGAMNFAQRAAARGIQGNAAGIPEIYRESALQGVIGGNNRQANMYRNNLDSEKTTLANNYQNDLVAAQQGAQATQMQNYIDQMNSDRNYQINKNESDSRLNATKQSQYANTATAYSADYQAEINNLLAKGYAEDSNEVMTLRALRAEKINNQPTSNMTYANALSAWKAGIDTPEIRQTLGL